MSDSSPPKDSSSSPPSSESPPSSDSSSSPPSSDSASSPPSDSSPPQPSSSSSPPSKDSDSSPPPPSSSDSSPPPPDSSPPPPPPVDSSPPPPPPKSDSPPPSSSSPPPSPPKDLAPPPPPPNVQPKSPPSPSPSSSIVALPPPSSNQATPPPPSPSTPLDSSPLPDTPTSSSSSPPSESLPSDSAPTPGTAVKPSSSDSTSSNSGSHSTPSSRHGGSSSSTSALKGSSSSSGSSGTGPTIGLALAGVVVALVIVFFVISRKKRRKLDALDYRPPPNFSVKSDGYYYRHGASGHADGYYVSQQGFSSGHSANLSGSHKGYGYQSGLQDPGGTRSWFTYEELSDVTNGFARENLIGEGGFGCVYKGLLLDGRKVAVKQLKAGSGQGEREFRAEVEIISRVHHRHLVSLVGYCIAEYHRLLVYEFLPNNTLEHHLHGKGLDWSNRLKIAIGSAKGLAYLHEDCHPRIIHRDIKSANILLDDSFEAQVADFGLAKLSNDTNTHVSTRVMGTFGYMAPEYASSGKLTDRSDVFSFGVVLLELITGRKPVDASQPLGDESLVEWARPLLVRALESGNCEELVDPRLENNCEKTEMFRMIEAAAACVRHSAGKRPRMVQVVRALDCEGEIADLSNGVKFGQSRVFDSGQYSADIQKFRQMAFGSGEYSSEYSGEYHSREAPKPPSPWRPGDHSSGEPELETRAMNWKSSDRNSGGYNMRPFP